MPGGITPEGAVLLALAALAAGIARGFTGFGTAMVFLPLAARVLSPAEAVLALLVFDFFGPLPLLRRAWAEADRALLTTLALPALLTLPVGFAALVAVAPGPFRRLAAALILVTVAAIAAGWRWGRPGRGVLRVAGALSGLAGGFLGMPGPPVILLVLGSRAAAARQRASLLVYLFGFDVVMLAIFLLSGEATPRALGAGLALTPIYTLAALAGARLFARWPAAAPLLRPLGLAMMAAAALSALI
ncbi:MAG: sulfite exporter TauE/SafE family protein [Alphaproteobacteria bacterium]|nr:MAG: sulfite exporter TauE/SafE family protein [Alphaproteobacteria bacterium]